MHLDLELLATFRAIVEGGGFTRAGERLHKTQSTVSQQLRRLEERIGAPLLTRTTRGLALTERGELLLGYARRLLSLEAEALAALVESRLSGPVALGCAQDLADEGLVELLSQFGRRYPEVTLAIHIDANSRLRLAVAQGELDLALLLQEPGAGGEPLARVARGWVAATGFRLPERGPLPLVLASAPCIFRDSALAALDSAGIPWRVALTTPSLPGLRAAVRAGLGVTPRTLRWLEPDLVVLNGPLPSLPELELALHGSAGAGSGAVQRLREGVREAALAL